MAQDFGKTGEFRSRLMTGSARVCLAGGAPFATHRRWLAGVAAALALAAATAHADVPPATALRFADAKPDIHDPGIGRAMVPGPADATFAVAFDENYRDTGRRPWFDDGEFGDGEFGERGDVGEQGEYSQGEFGERGEAGSSGGSTGGDATADESGELLEGLGEGGEPSGNGSPLLPGGGSGGGGGLIP